MSSKIIFKKEGVFLKSEKETEFIKFKKIRKICKRHGFYVIVHNSTSTSIDYHQYDDICKKWEEYWDRENLLDKFFNEVQFIPGEGIEYLEAKERFEKMNK